MGEVSEIGRFTLRRGMRVLIRFAEESLEGTVVEVAPHVLRIEPIEPVPAFARGGRITIAAVDFGAPRALLDAPPAPQSADLIEVPPPPPKRFVERAPDEYFSRERRHYRRLPVEAEAKLDVGKESVNATTSDMSLGGAALVLRTMPKELVAGMEIDVTIKLSEGDLFSRSLVKSVSPGENGVRVGLEFRAMSTSSRLALAHSLEAFIVDLNKRALQRRAQ